MYIKALDNSYESQLDASTVY